MLVPIEPPLDGRTAERFPAYMQALAALQVEGGRDRVSNLLRGEIEWLDRNRHLGEQAMIYESCVRVLADLVRLRWRVVPRAHGYALENPSDQKRSRTTAELVASKDAIRDELRPVVDEQRMQPAVRDFVRKMEQGTRLKRSIFELITDDAELAERLAPATALAGEARVDALRASIQPYLQRATGEADAFTGISLREIWRYFRYSWSIPQTPVPGRQLLYLVRDAAHPRHAVMGIAALNNCPLEMGETRETYIGWHRRSVAERFLSARAEGEPALAAELAWIRERLDVSLGEVEWTNLVTPEEVAAPNEDIIQRIGVAHNEFSRVREVLLREIAENTGDVFNPSLWARDDAPPVDDEILRLEAKASANARMHAARKYLVAKKRARALGRLLEAKLIFERNEPALTDPARVAEALGSDEIKRAINIVVEALKARRAGANLLEITTCGAVAPYGPILGGKLVALLMLSPQVGADYQAAYDAPSIISSQMLNRPVIRDNKLVYLGTTSLYAHGSSQYNRLKLPAATFAPDQPELRYEPIGETTGFGTLQFSPETSRAIDQLVSASKAFKDVNSVFGEGTSPKLRKLKQGMRLIGFNPDRMLRHEQKRLIYAAPLASNSREWLLERSTDLPTYLANPGAFPQASEAIAEYWRQRWLAGRLDRQYSRQEENAPGEAMTPRRMGGSRVG